MSLELGFVFLPLVTTYFIIAEEPESRGLVELIVGDAQVVGSRLENGIFIPTLGFAFVFHHLAGVQGCLQTNGALWDEETVAGTWRRRWRGAVPTSSVSSRPLSSYSERTQTSSWGSVAASKAAARAERRATFHIRRFALIVVLAFLISARSRRGVHILVLRYSHI